MAAPQPDPYNFKIIDERSIGPYVFAEIDYPDATNFEGRKLLVCRREGFDTLRGLSSLDPHFLEDSGVVIVARFRPDQEGRLMMRAFMDMVKSRAQ